MRYITTIGEVEYDIEVIDDEHIKINGHNFLVDFDSIAGQPVYSLLVDGDSYEAYVYPIENEWQVLLQGRSFTVLVEEEIEKRLRSTAGENIGERKEFHLKAPMPGLVVTVQVGEGQEVNENDVLVVLESMKMQNELKSPRAGIITRLLIEAGDNVDQNQTLMSVV
jgi:biotin carboxyl carrier protein